LKLSKEKGMRQVVADADSDAGHLVEPAGGQFVQVAGIFFPFFFPLFSVFQSPLKMLQQALT
jgi:hypothetical protein